MWALPMISLTIGLLTQATPIFFSPQDKKAVTGEYIDPLIGNSTELGIKGEFLIIS